MVEADAKQLQEAVLASQNSTRRSSSSSLSKRVTCEICFEDHESCQMFKNSTCSHSFCNICTSKHATTKIQANNKTIACPGINCKSILDSKSLRLIIPKETLIKWDEFLRESAIPESRKLYCPFTNCSAMFIPNNKRSFRQSVWSFLTNSATKINCPVCRRSFCTVCQVPWHSNFSCREFRRLEDKTGDALVMALAKKKQWKRCPSCKFFVEKRDGCNHITCRCSCNFRYI